MIDIGLSQEERRRAAPLANHIARTFSECRRKRQPVYDYVLARRDNLRTFLTRFPHLRYDPGICSYLRLMGKHARAGWVERLPGEDHTFFWRTKGVRGPIVATTFPYAWGDETNAEAEAFARAHGLRLEVRPPDVPDLWYPGWTVPIVWSRGGIDWRTPALRLTAAEPAADEPAAD